MELDYLKGEATNANLEKPGAWEDFMSNEQLTEMMRVWNEVDIELRKACLCRNRATKWRAGYGRTD